LTEAITLAVVGSFLPVLTPVVGVVALPVALAVSLVGAVVGITGEFVSLPLGFSGPLAGCMGAEALGFDARTGHKRGAAVATPQGVVHGFLLTEATNLPKEPLRRRKNTNHIQSRRGRKSRVYTWGEGEEEPGGPFSQCCAWFTFSVLRVVLFLAGVNTLH
jgi:hypothetical protein